MTTEPSQTPEHRELGKPAGDLRAVRPAVATPQLELMRERAERRLFGVAEPARLGRFILLGELAAGGMGVVFGAFDPQLDRRVALKLVHPDVARTKVSRDRLLVEARALARLDHPNVVPIHDVVVADDQVVIVMEWVEGQTVANWEREQPRSWREVVSTYAGAARGLAAAHALGLVHRDFKPANAIIGGDGRVRILDFGLARFAAAGGATGMTWIEPTESAPDRFTASDHDPDPDPTPMAHPGRHSQPGVAAGLTVPGEVLGTLAYMAPEQLAGEVATAASDQFSFCVAVYRSVCGVEPYGGVTLEERVANLEAARLTPPSRGRFVPSWLRAVLERGLAVPPADRHPSMAALLDELLRERGWRRWRLPIVAAAAAAIAGVGVAALHSDSENGASCDGGATEIAALWTTPQRAAIASAFSATRTPFTSVIRDAVVRGLDDYGDQWMSMHRAACIAHRDGVQSDALLDRRMTCLLRRKQALAAAVAVLGQIDRTSLVRAREVVANLPAVDDCGEVELLAQDGEPPPARLRAAIDAQHARLARAEALEQLGRSAEALSLIRDILPDAERLGDAVLRADVELAQGRILLFVRELEGARAPLEAAQSLAFEHGLLSRGIVAAARRLYVEAVLGLDLPGLLRQAGLLELISRPLRDGFARPLLLNNIGVLHLAMENRGKAGEAFSRAKAALASVAHPAVELSGIDHNLAMVTTDDAEREQLLRSVWERRRAQLGDQHQQTLEMQLSYGKYLTDLGRALSVTRDVCARYREVYPEMRPQRVDCNGYLALVARESGDEAAALSAYDEIFALVADARSDDFPKRLLAAGSAAWLQSEVKAARAAFEQVLRLPVDTDWWEQRDRAEAHLGLGLTWRTNHNQREAVAHLERAIEIYAELSQINEEFELKLRLARARSTLAEVLRHQGGADERAAELERLAAGRYRARTTEVGRPGVDTTGR